MIYIGIDPGKNGGIACISDDKNNVEAFPYSDDFLICYLGFVYTQGWQDNVICYLEHVHAMPKQGVSSTFNFGMNFGFIQGVLKAYGIPYELVTPQKWKKEFAECEGYVERMIAPPKTEDTKNCKYCPYKGICRKVD